jgi:signal transduction histidine kinase
MNKTFLADYYQYNKVEILGSAYEKVNMIYKEANKTIDSDEESIDDLDEETQEAMALALERIESNQNLKLYVINASDIYLASGVLAIEYPPSRSLMDKQFEQLVDRVSTYLSGKTNSHNRMKLLKKEEDYGIYKIYDERMESYYIELFGQLDNGYLIYLRSNFESMQESVSISNKFLAYVGFGATLLGIIIMLLVTNRFTKPIHQLSDIAKKMAKLDFNVKYTVKSQDEIGELGTSINTLSEKLEETISELKSANNELLSDIQNKIQIDELRKEFLSNVSHELKTPIALIQGYAEGLIENINDDAESRNFYCEVIVDEASKMNKMVKRLLSLNQIEFGNNQVNIERFDIVALIKAVLNSTDILIQKKEAKVQFSNYPSTYVWADEYMIEEVITNYISNALNHLDGDRIIDIKLTQLTDRIRISVFNTGANIPDDDLDKIWIKFYKVDKARTREYGGNGIGLSIVKAIMTSLNRECGVINHTNGVEFWFELDTKI